MIFPDDLDQFFLILSNLVFKVVLSAVRSGLVDDFFVFVEELEVHFLSFPGVFEQNGPIFIETVQELHLIAEVHSS